MMRPIGGYSEHRKYSVVEMDGYGGNGRGYGGHCERERNERSSEVPLQMMQLVWNV